MQRIEGTRYQDWTREVCGSRGKKMRREKSARKKPKAWTKVERTEERRRGSQRRENKNVQTRWTGCEPTRFCLLSNLKRNNRGIRWAEASSETARDVRKKMARVSFLTLPRGYDTSKTSPTCFSNVNIQRDNEDVKKKKRFRSHRNSRYWKILTDSLHQVVTC